MSWKATGLVKELLRCADGTPLTLSAKMVYLLLAEAHNTTHRIAWPSVSELAELGLMSYRQVQRQLRFLEEHGEIRQLRPDSQGKGMICSYRLLRIDPESVPPSEPERVTNRHPLKHGESGKKGDQSSPFIEHKGDGRVTEGRQKDDLGDTLCVPPKGRESRGNGGTGEQDLNNTPSGALTQEQVKAWLAIKEKLGAELSPEERGLWLRPARLLRVMGGRMMQIALPPNGRIVSHAREKRKRLQEIALAAGYGIALTTYPDEWQRGELKRRHGIDLTPKQRRPQCPPA